MRILVFTALFSIMSTAIMQAQDARCGSGAATHQIQVKYPELKSKLTANEMVLRKSKLSFKSENEKLVIPVVFHVIHQFGHENISDYQIQSAVDILNEDFNALNDTTRVVAEFKHLVASANIEFRLAKIDPEGNCTNGIDRIYSVLKNYGDDNSKLNPWPNNEYLNIWVFNNLNVDKVAAYTYYPAIVDGALAKLDGIVILHDYLGNVGTGARTRDYTLTHTIAHWLNLTHPWSSILDEDSSNAEQVCGDDGLEDTPITKGHCYCSLLKPDCVIDTLDNAVFNFSSVNQTSGAKDLTPIDTKYKLAELSLFRANNLANNSSKEGAFAFSGWPTGAVNGASTETGLTGKIDTSKYYEISIAPKLGAVQKINFIEFKVNRSANGPRSFALAYERNRLFNFIPSQGNNSIIKANNYSRDGSLYFIVDTVLMQTGFSFSVNSNFDNQAIKFRVYAWNAEDDSGVFELDDFKINGELGIVENVQNFMEFSFCLDIFTPNQVERMRNTLMLPYAGRNNLCTPDNLIKTGVSNAECLPVADFFTERRNTCSGGSIQFFESVSKATPTKIEWVFEGGTPPTSTDRNPEVVYNQAGSYTVSLICTNNTGVDTTIRLDYINVLDNAELVYNGFFDENYNIEDTVLKYWSLTELASDWSYHKEAGTNTSGALGVNTFSKHTFSKDYLLGPVVDMSRSTSAKVSFDYAAAANYLDTNHSAELTLEMSRNCGKTWSSFAVIKDSLLLNNGVVGNLFVPTTQSVWNTRLINIPKSFLVDKLYFRFKYHSVPSSNSIYIDNFNISSESSTNEFNTELTKLSINPNPAAEGFDLFYELSTNSMVQVSIFDLLGKKIYESNNVNQVRGTHKLRIALKEKAGIYTVNVKVGEEFKTLKLVLVD